MNTTGKVIQIQFTDPDFEDVFQMDQRDFPRPWSRLVWMDLDPRLYHLLELKSHFGVEGFCLFLIAPGDDAAHLLKICLKKEFRGQGRAVQFWIEILGYLKGHSVNSVFLEVEADNRDAIHFYSKVSFNRLRFIKGYYSDGKDALTMSLTL